MSDGAAKTNNIPEKMAVDDDKREAQEEVGSRVLRVEPMEEAPLLNEFSGSGRTGRRNALPNIMQQNIATTGTSAITNMLDQLSCSGGGNERPEEDQAMGACGGSDNAPNQRLNPNQ